MKRVPIIVSHKKTQKMGETHWNPALSKKKAVKVVIYKKAHYKKGKLDKAELASTVKHELLHVKNPKLTEKEVYKKTAKTKITPSEQTKLLAKLRTKKINYQVGTIKRKFKMKSSEGNKPGDLINASRLKKAVQVLI